MPNNTRTRITTVEVIYDDNEIGTETVNLDIDGAPSIQSMLVQWCHMNSDVKCVTGCSVVFDFPIKSDRYN